MNRAYILPKKIIEMSHANNWEEARKEWRLKDIYYLGKDEESLTCLCEHYPIREIITIENFLTKNKVIVGNCCINKFFEMDTNKIFKALQQNRLNSAIIDMAFNKNLINQKEYDFLKNVWRKRKLSLKQKKWFESLKVRIKESFIYKEGAAVTAPNNPGDKNETQ